MKILKIKYSERIETLLEERKRRKNKLIKKPYTACRLEKVINQNIYYLDYLSKINNWIKNEK